MSESDGEGLGPPELPDDLATPAEAHGYDDDDPMAPVGAGARVEADGVRDLEAEIGAEPESLGAGLAGDVWSSPVDLTAEGAPSGGGAKAGLALAAVLVGLLVAWLLRRRRA